MIARGRAAVLLLARRCACGSTSAQSSQLSSVASAKPTTAHLSRFFSQLSLTRPAHNETLPSARPSGSKPQLSQLRCNSSEAGSREQGSVEQSDEDTSTAQSDALAQQQGAIDEEVSATTGSGGATARPIAMPGASTFSDGQGSSDDVSSSQESSTPAYSSPFLSPEQISQQRAAAATPRHYSMPGTSEHASSATPTRIRQPFPLWVVTTGHGNTKLTLTRPNGSPLTWTSGGSAGFKKSQRSGYEAGYRASTKMFALIGKNRNKWAVDSVEIVFKGISGTGRDAFSRALLSQEGAMVRRLAKSVRDATPLKIGGVRPKKQRNY
ncbi:translational machinery component [Ceraceosorus guamensis]|uniref:Translational machinery component n=1 Tax=Ceraceosorus guamensis TaxID=1522189 RepID=A0A316VUB1_9BASI|nr:translational machinery component [Ceraceosorus guamensis]PWN40824.1 translational machinery component [Ceraceosorus guamensis]